MLQSFRRSFLLLVGLFLFAAAPVLAQVGPDSVRRAAWQQFQAESGSQWKVRWGERAGIPRSIYGGATRSFSGSPETAARSFLAQYRDLFKMKPDLRGLELKSVNTLRGIHHVRFQQTYEDIPVYEAEYLVHVREDGRVDMANGHYYPDIDVSTHPRIDPSSAERIAIQKIEGTPIREEITIEQVIYPVQESFSLAWKITVPLEPFGGWVYFVDAMSGTVLDAQNQLVDATGTKTVSEEHSHSSFPGTGLFREGRRSSMSVSGTGTVYPTHPGLSSPTNVTLKRLDGSGELQGSYVEVVNDAQSNAFSSSLDFTYSTNSTHFDEVNLYYQVDQFRNSYINSVNGGSLGFTQITAHAHAVHPQYGENNACFDRNTEEVYFGDASSSASRNNFAREDKVIYHEYVHALTYDLNSGIRSESSEEGAISEGNADYFAGAYTGRTKILDYAVPFGERDMSNPAISSYSQYENQAPVEAHDGGEFWSAVLWGVRNHPDISTSEADWLVYSGISRVSSNPDFLEYRDVMLAEDRTTYGGQHQCMIKRAFEDHGIGEAFTTGIAGPTTLDNGENGNWTASYECGSGSVSYAWEVRPPGSSTWTSTSGSSQSYSDSFQHSKNQWLDAGVRVIVTRGTETDTSEQTVMVGPPSCSPTPCISSNAAGPRGLGLQNFRARGQGPETAALRWQATGRESSTTFVVQHRTDSTAAWSEVGRVAASDSVAADTSRGATYRFRAKNLSVGTHQFRLRAQTEGAKNAFTSWTVSAEIRLEEAYDVTTYPNPVQRQATIELAVRERQNVTVAVYDVLGRQVTTLHDGSLPAQETTRLSLNASQAGLSSGTYFVRVTGEAFAGTRRLTVVR